MKNIFKNNLEALHFLQKEFRLIIISLNSKNYVYRNIASLICFLQHLRISSNMWINEMQDEKFGWRDISEQVKIYFSYLTCIKNIKTRRSVNFWIMCLLKLEKYLKVLEHLFSCVLIMELHFMIWLRHVCKFTLNNIAFLSWNKS